MFAMTVLVHNKGKRQSGATETQAAETRYDIVTDTHTTGTETEQQSESIQRRCNEGHCVITADSNHPHLHIVVYSGQPIVLVHALHAGAVHQ